MEHMTQGKKSNVGPPIWVESCLTAEELVESHRKYPTTVLSSKHIQYDSNRHKGGKWRQGSWSGLTEAEVKVMQEDYYKLIQNIRNYVLRNTGEPVQGTSLQHTDQLSS